MGNEAVQGLINQIYQHSNQYEQLSESRKIASNGVDNGLFETAGKASQKYLFGKAAASVEKEIATIFTEEAAKKAGEEGLKKAAAGGFSKALGTAAGVGGIVYGGYEIVDNWGTRDPLSGAINGATVGAGTAAVGGAVAGGAMSGSWAGPIGMAVGALVGGLLGFVKSGKHDDQIQRDNFRSLLQDHGIIDKDFKIALADGSRYDIGIDGRPKPEFNNMRPFEIDFNREGAGDLIGMISPFVTVLCGDNVKLRTDFTGYFVNAALSNAGGDIEKAKDNALAIFKQTHLSSRDVVGGLMSLSNQGKIEQSELQALLGGFRDLLSDEPYELKAPKLAA